MFWHCSLMNTNRKHMKIPGFARAQIRKAKKNVLYREAAKVYKRKVLHREKLQHHSFSVCTVQTTAAIQAELTEDIQRLTQRQVHVIFETEMIAVYHCKRTQNETNPEWALTQSLLSGLFLDQLQLDSTCPKTLFTANTKDGCRIQLLSLR